MTLKPYALIPGQQDSAIAKCVTLGHVKVWYSYGEPIGFKVGEEPAIVLYSWFSPYHGNLSRRNTAKRHVDEVIRLTLLSHKCVNSVVFETLYNEMLSRLQSADLGAPPDIVADFLIDNGLTEAAVLVRKTFGKRNK